MVKDLNLPRFKLEKYFTGDCNTKTNTGEYSCLKVQLVFKRGIYLYNNKCNVMHRLEPLARNWTCDSSLEPSRHKKNSCEGVFCLRAPRARSARKCDFYYIRQL